jgi:hypothetical protein
MPWHVAARVDFVHHFVECLATVPRLARHAPEEQLWALRQDGTENPDKASTRPEIAFCRALWNDGEGVACGMEGFGEKYGKADATDVLSSGVMLSTERILCPLVRE